MRFDHESPRTQPKMEDLEQNNFHCPPCDSREEVEILIANTTQGCAVLSMLATTVTAAAFPGRGSLVMLEIGQYVRHP